MGNALKRAPRRSTAASKHQVVGSKGGSAKPKQPSIASNSVPSIATVRILYLWSWGPIVGPVNGLRSVKLRGTPVMADDGTLTYPGVKWQFRSGELNQERMTGISESSNEIQVGQQLLSTTPYVHTITNSMLDAVRLRFSWPQLQSQDSGGNVDGVRIEYAVDVSTDNGPFQQVLLSEVNRKNVTKYERSHRIDLPPGSRWAIRARRITPEANSSLVQDGMYVEAIAEVVDSDQEYPLTAVSCVEYDAEQFGGDIAKIAVLMRGRIVRVPMNYDPATRTYATSGAGTSNGVWDGTFKEAYTNNPVWVFYDLALHPYYGLGDRIDATMINRWSLYRIGQYCDQMVPDGKGGQEPRFTCNLYLQKQAEAWAVLQDLAAIFHGLAFWDGSQITVNADMPQDPVYNYTLSQILDDGAVKYTGSKLRERHSQAMVSFDDPDRGFDTDKEPVFYEAAIAEYGVRETSVEAVGCTSRGQAQRAGQWALMTEQLQLRGASFRVGLDGYIPKPGKVITLSDPMLAGRANGGRIAAVAGRVVTVDRDIEVPTGARLLVNLPSGKSEARQVRSVAGRQITVMADFSEAPQPECGWVLDFDDLKLMQFYVRNVTRPEWHQFQLECIQYEPSKFDAIDYGTVIDDRPISVLPPGVQDAPARVLITSHSAVDQGIAVTTMTISWDAAPGAVAYDVEWRWGSRDWVKVPRTGELAADVRGVYAGQYIARVRAVSAMGVSSIPATSVLTNVAGKTTPPPAVTHLLTTPLVYAIGLKWGFPAGAEDTERTEIWYSTTTSLDNAIKLSDFAYPQQNHTLQLGAAGAQLFFWARLVDRTGNIGPWYPAGVGVSGQSSSNQSEYEEYFKDKISNGALYPALREEISLISGPPAQSGSVAQRLAAEATARAQAIAAEATARGQAIAAETSARNQALAAEVIERNKAIAVETQARTKAISDESAARAQGLLSEAQARGAAITSEAQARQSADESLSQKIETVTAAAGNNAAAIQAEATTRANADSALGQSLATVAANTASNAAAISNETTARTTADAAMASQIASLRAESGGFDSTLNYGFASTVEGWSGTRCTLTVENGRLILTNDSAGAYLNSPLVAIKGRDHDRIRCRITRRAGTGWTGQVSYTTAAHGSSTAYNKVLPNPGLAVGQSMVLEWDMSQLTNGGSDWSDSTITRFYLWISGTAGDVFEIDWIAVGQIAPSASVASVVDERTARISGDEANASAVTALGSSLTTTNQNVTAAQQAAQDAATLAGGKGKVLVQATAPAAADRLPQNLWIDTTGNANTPKRWNGTAWLAVTDKVATDAAAAAQSALSQLAGKADASALQALSTTVSNQGNTLSSQGSSITELNNSLQTTNGNVATAQQAAQAASTLAGSKGKVLYQSAAPVVADRQAENLWIDTTGGANTPKRWNGSAWVAVTDKVATDAAAAAASALAQVANKADASALQALNSTVTSQGTTLTSQGAALTQLKASIGQQPDNLILRGSFEDGLVDPWTADPVITSISAHPSAGKGIAFYNNSFCGVGFNVLTKGGEQFDLAADVWPNYMTAGQTTRLQMQFQDKAGASLGYFTAFTVSAASTGFKAQAGRITAPEGAVSARFVTRTEPADGTGRSLWCNILARRVTAADAANADAVTNLTTTVTQQGATLTSHGQALTQLNNDLQTVAQGKADASALQTLSNTVTSQGSTLSSQGASITQLNSGLQTTNGNVTGAQQAAQAASDKAGAKGEVIYGTAAPAADKRLAQNLWIDTTGGANTPKRWAGSAWVAVTDKAATDAAAAAASALAQVATKADASALQTLSNTVTNQGNTLTSQGNALTGLQASIGNLAGSGANLLGSEYSWLASTALPVTGGTLLTKVGVAVPEADSGFGYSLQAATDSVFSYIVMAPANNQASYNIRVEPGVYLVSMYVKGGTAGSMMANLYDGVTSRSVILPYTTERTRITFPITITVSTKVGLLIYPNRHAAASASMVVDSIMVEKRVGESNVPSPFVAGPSARATGVLAAANQALDVRVTQAESGLSSTSAAVTDLGNSLQTTNGNVTTAQQAAQAAADLAGSKGKVLYQTGTPAVSDRQAENLWIDTTGAANTPKRWNGSAWVAVTDKVATDAAAAAQSALTQLASKADASALQTLQSTVTSQGGTINSQGAALTQLKASLSQQPDNLVLRGTFEDGLVDPWTGNPGIAGLTAHPSAGKAIAFYANSFCGTGRFIVSGGEQLDLSADVYRAYMTAGQTGNFQVQFFDKTDTNLGYFNAFTFSAGGGFQTFSGRITAPAAAVSARFVTRIQPADGTGRALWCNIVARRVTAADAANGEAISTLGTTVTQQGTTLTSQGQSLLSLTNRMTDAEGVNSAQATAISQMDTTVKQQGTAITAAATRLDGLYVQVNPEMEGDSTGLAGATGGLVGVWTEQSARIEDGIAIGRQVETVQAQMGQTNASVQQVSEVVAGIDGRVSAQTTLKVETNQNGRKVVSGIAIGSNGEEGEILLMAQRLAIIDSLNGEMILPFVAQGGQVFMNSAIINQADILNLIITGELKSANFVAGQQGIRINFVTGEFEINGVQPGQGRMNITNRLLTIYDSSRVRLRMGLPG